MMMHRRVFGANANSRCASRGSRWNRAQELLFDGDEVDRGRFASAQMAVEFAAMLPVIVIAAFVFVNVMVFAGDCVSFDMAAREAARMQADDGWENDSAAQVQARLEERLPFDYESIEVSCEKTGLGHVRYTARMAFRPPFLRGVSVFGVDTPPLVHEVEFTVSPYRKGVVV